MVTQSMHKNQDKSAYKQIQSVTKHIYYDFAASKN